MLRASYPYTLHPSHPHSTPHLTQHTPSRSQGAHIWSSGKSLITWPLCWNGRWGRGCVWTTLRLYSTIFSLSPTTSCRWTHRPGRVRRGMRERKMEGGGGKGECCSGRELEWRWWERKKEYWTFADYLHTCACLTGLASLHICVCILVVMSCTVVLTQSDAAKAG